MQYFREVGAGPGCSDSGLPCSGWGHFLWSVHDETRVQGTPGIPHIEEVCSPHRICIPSSGGWGRYSLSPAPPQNRASGRGGSRRSRRLRPSPRAVSGTLDRRDVRSWCSRPPSGSPGRWGRHPPPGCPYAKVSWPYSYPVSLLSTGPPSSLVFGRPVASTVPDKKAQPEGGSPVAAWRTGHSLQVQAIARSPSRVPWHRPHKPQFCTSFRNSSSALTWTLWFPLYLLNLKLFFIHLEEASDSITKSVFLLRAFNEYFYGPKLKGQGVTIIAKSQTTINLQYESPLICHQ